MSREGRSETSRKVVVQTQFPKAFIAFARARARARLPPSGRRRARTRVMSFGRANANHVIRRTWTDTPTVVPPKQHGSFAFTHPASSDPTAGRDPVDAFYDGIKLRAWHGQQSVSGEDLGIGRHHPPILCAVTSPHMFGTGFLVMVKDAGDALSNHNPVPCLLMPHRVVRGLEHDFSMMIDELDVVTRVVPPSTHRAPGRYEFYITNVQIDPERYFRSSPMPIGTALHDENHLDYVLVAVRDLPTEIPTEWIRCLESAADFGYHPAPEALNILGQAPKLWLDPSARAVGGNAVGVHWRKGRVLRSEREVPESGLRDENEHEHEKHVSDNNGGISGHRCGIGFMTQFNGEPPASASAGGAVLACMTDETARAAGARNSMAADTRFAASVRPFASPLLGYGDWGVLVGMHRGGSFTAGESDILRIADVVVDLRRKRAAGEANVNGVSTEPEASAPVETQTFDELSHTGHDDHTLRKKNVSFVGDASDMNAQRKRLEGMARGTPRWDERGV